MSDPTQEQIDSAREAGFRNQLTISGANDEQISSLQDTYGNLHQERTSKYENLSKAIGEFEDE